VLLSITVGVLAAGCGAVDDTSLEGGAPEVTTGGWATMTDVIDPGPADVTVAQEGDCIVDMDCAAVPVGLCEQATCEQGRCEVALAADGAPCEDAPCLSGMTCQKGLCGGG